MQTLWQDLRYGVRILMKQPGFTLIAVITLALGIGANTAIFSFVDTFFYRPLPAHDPYRLMKVEAIRNGRWDWGYAYPAYAYFRDHSQSFEALAAHYSTAPLNVVAGGDSRMVNGAVVSANYFSTLGVNPRLGRFFLQEEDSAPDRDTVAVISFAMWQRSFGGDPAVLGKEVGVNGRVFKIIGVTPEGFLGVEAGYPNEMWIPTMMLRLGWWVPNCDPFNNFGCRPLTLIGRLAPGRTLTEARAEFGVFASQLAAVNPENKGRDVLLSPALGVRTSDRADFSYQMQLLLTVSGLLLLIACANVAGLLLVRGAARRKEMVVRLCLGAGRMRLVRQLMTESLMLAVAGGALGLILSFWAKDLLLVFYASDSKSYDLSLNPRVLAYSLAMTIFTGLAFGLMPAIQATRHDLAGALKDEGVVQGPRHNRWRSALVIGQVALSSALLVAAGLMVRSAAHIRQGANFDPTRIAMLRLRPQMAHYSPEKAQALTREVVRRLEALPGVKSVSLVLGDGLAWRATGEVGVRLPEQKALRPEDEVRVSYHEIAPRFFETLKIPLLQGRDFNAGDLPSAERVVIVNETLARRMWANGAPVSGALIVQGQAHRVVGVFKDAQFRNTLEAPLPFLYLPLWQDTAHIDSHLVVRTAGDPQDMLPLLRREVAAVDPNVPIDKDNPMIEQVKAKYISVLLTSNVLICSGALALLLSMIGLFGVLAFSVAQRTREIGIRMALGAQQREVLTLVVRQGLSLAMVGVALGLVAAFGLTRVMANLLFGVSATDPVTFALVAMLVVVSTLLSCYLPARRATKVDPMVALKYE